jgi:adenylate kinase
MGPPGAGKGTQAEGLARESRSAHLATGDMLRQALRDETPLGLEAKRYMDSGTLVPDSVVLGLVEERLTALAPRTGFVLDGFPRTVPQAEGLDLMLDRVGRPLDGVLVLDVADEVVVARLSSRRTCTACGAVYAAAGRPERLEDDRCDRCGGVLGVRSDDRPETVRRRLQVYREETAPVVAHYELRGLVGHVDGEGSVDAVRERLVAAVHAAAARAGDES